MKAVLDVSAAYALIMNANDTKLIQQVLAEADLVKSPDLFIAEASNTAWKYHRFRGLSEEQCQDICQTAIALVDIFAPSSVIWKQAFALACQHEHTVYDCLYLSLAQSEGAILLTKDKKLSRLAQTLGIPLNSTT